MYIYMYIYAGMQYGIWAEAGVNIRKEIVDKAYYVFPVFPVSSFVYTNPFHNFVFAYYMCILLLFLFLFQRWRLRLNYFLHPENKNPEQIEKKHSDVYLYFIYFPFCFEQFFF